MNDSGFGPPLRIGIAGLGTVGQGVLRVLTRNASLIEARCGRKLVVTHASVRNRTKRRNCDLGNIVLLDDPFRLAESDIDVVVELMGGLETAQQLIVSALKAGKSVVTANKALLAERGDIVIEAAERSGRALGFEAAVGGGIPVIQSLREGLAGNRVDSISGIINGTSNYVLSRMSQENLAFSDALAEAKKLGYAEADPSFDIDGTDAAHKLAILAAIAFAIPPSFASIFRESLDVVRIQDVHLAKELGYRIKPLGIAKRGTQGIELRVHPTLVPAHHPLASVDGSLNAVRIHGDAVGQTVLIGAGAGAEPTASAVVADLIEIGKGRAPSLPLGQPIRLLKTQPFLSPELIQSAFYIRLQLTDTPGALRALTTILAERKISVEAILQKEPHDQKYATLALITSTTSEGNCDRALEKISELPFAHGQTVRLRVEYFEDLK